jgi:broad specificity phosphatase PhoE
VNELVVARHGESELSVVDRLNGDPTVEVRLTDAGREQAKALGRTVGHVDLVAHTEFGRTRETAELAWPDAPLLLVPELNEIRFGRFEGMHWMEGYHEWVLTSAPDEACPGDGESRLAAVQRYLRGFRLLLERPEARVALVAHGAQVRYLLLALENQPPARVLERVEPARPYVVGADALAQAVDLIEQWAETPAF